MKKYIIFFAIILYIFLPLSAQEGSETVSGITFSWEVKGEFMDITLSAPTKGWVSVGFNPSSVMKDADFYIGYVKGGEVFIRDDYGRGRTSHVDDERLGGTADVEVLGGEETPEGTTLRFRIPLNSGDEFDHAFVSGREIPVIFAYARSDNFTGIHQGKGKRNITFNW